MEHGLVYKDLLSSCELFRSKLFGQWRSNSCITGMHTNIAQCLFSFSLFSGCLAPFTAIIDCILNSSSRGLSLSQSHVAGKYTRDFEHAVTHSCGLIYTLVINDVTL